MAELAIGESGAPEDAQTVATAELKSLKERIDKLLARSQTRRLQPRSSAGNFRSNRESHRRASPIAKTVIGDRCFSACLRFQRAADE